MNTAYILLGANLGNPLGQIEQAKKLISSDIGKITVQSSVYETEAWGIEEQPPFFNQVLQIETSLTPTELLLACQNIEDGLGRVRKEKWGARVIDIDILYFNDEQIRVKNLVIPHPYLHFRKFTLVPLCEVAGEYLHPILHKTNKEILEANTDPLSVKKLSLQ